MEAISTAVGEILPVVLAVQVIMAMVAMVLMAVTMEWDTKNPGRKPGLLYFNKQK